MNLNKYLISYLIENSEYPDDEEIIRSLKIELDWRVYHYGESFSKPWPGLVKKNDLRRKLANAKNAFLLSRNKADSYSPNEVLSTIYFSNFNGIVENLGYPVSIPFWAAGGLKINGNLSLFKKSLTISHLLKYATVAEILEKKNKELIVQFKEEMQAYYKQYPPRAVLLFTDQYFFSKITIQIFKSINRPSYILSHGLPGAYSKYAEHSSDKLLVWGSKIRENYIKAGFAEDKVAVLGHPAYKNFKSAEQEKLRFGFTDVLVLAKAVSWHQHTYDAKIVDRGLIIVYLLSLKKILQSVGVKKARLRPHPSQNINWILDFVGRDFFVKDDSRDLKESLTKASVVIGPTSTILMESLLYNVNYVVYEPQDENGDLYGNEVVSPFNGDDEHIPVAKDEDSLKHLLQDRISCSKHALNGYMDRFDIDVLKTCLSYV